LIEKLKASSLFALAVAIRKHALVILAKKENHLISRGFGARKISFVEVAD
jgi:hypothetical protein